MSAPPAAQVAAVPEGSGSARLTAWHLLTLSAAWSAVLPLAALAAAALDGGAGLAAAVSGGCAASLDFWSFLVANRSPAGAPILAEMNQSRSFCVMYIISADLLAAAPLDSGLAAAIPAGARYAGSDSSFARDAGSCRTDSSARHLHCSKAVPSGCTHMRGCIAACRACRQAVAFDVH